MSTASWLACVNANGGPCLDAEGLWKRNEEEVLSSRFRCGPEFISDFLTEQVINWLRELVVSIPVVCFSLFVLLVTHGSIISHHDLRTECCCPKHGKLACRVFLLMHLILSWEGIQLLSI